MLSPVWSWNKASSVWAGHGHEWVGHRNPKYFHALVIHRELHPELNHTMNYSKCTQKSHPYKIIHKFPVVISILTGINDHGDDNFFYWIIYIYIWKQHKSLKMYTKNKSFYIFNEGTPSVGHSSEIENNPFIKQLPASVLSLLINKIQQILGVFSVLLPQMLTIY